ncbi:uncharacterized protein PHALS_03183 [Plasmopara halstedii]|uniref:Uncharacterized protein n=1 Tax=Plasmopara halstedii TaxID=4781 RepID=A0A0P1A479_PLAHL|nr:uncharacterized protein PHALS_03183 [Plasmopara halstedii]CEG35213.1 hypothetical protein PHALS_03183 [Plasmopara halstedii]|eukprot:XP_024571582.1 hypothetical protein PHALS_03183 [Plasmopara halstedii]
MEVICDLQQSQLWNKEASKGKVIDAFLDFHVYCPLNRARCMHCIKKSVVYNVFSDKARYCSRGDTVLVQFACH